MKKNSYLLNTLLAVFVMIALAVMVLVRTFQPAAILLMNLLTWAIDRYTPPRRFGTKKGGKA